MRTQTIEQTIYSYSDLLLPENESLKKKVLSNLFDINVSHDWWDWIYRDFKTEIASNYGFDVGKIYFSGFSSQGDGAMFEGRVIDFSKFITNNHINRLLKHNVIGVEMSFQHYGNYCHERSYTDTFDTSFLDNHSNAYDYFINLEDEICAKYEQVCRELYHNLEKEHDYFISEEAIRETIEANGYEFDENGNII